MPDFFALKCTVFNFGRGSAPDHTGGAYSLPDILAGGEELAAPLSTRAWPYGPCISGLPVLMKD